MGEFMKSNNGLVRVAVLRALACASGLLLATPDSASADPARFDINAQPLPAALKSFATQAKMQLLYRYDIVSHAKRTRWPANSRNTLPWSNCCEERDWRRFTVTTPPRPFVLFPREIKQAPD